MTEEKAKVVASVWGEEFIPFLVALAVLPRVSEPAYFGTAPVPAPGKREQRFGFFLTD